MASPAKTAAAAEGAEPKPAAPARSKGGMGVAIGAAVLAAALASGGTWFLTGHGKAPAAAEGAAPAEADKPAKPALYLDMTPTFVVNLADDETMRFLQVEVEVMARDPKAIDAVKDHAPRIRNALLMLFGQQHYHDLSTREAKEALQKRALDEVQHALQDENVTAPVEAVYFTSFVMQ